MNLTHSVSDKRILGWKHYQYFYASPVQALEQQNHSVRLIPSLAAAAIIVVIVAQVLAFIDGQLELRAMEMQDKSSYQPQYHFALVPTAHAASMSAKKMITSAHSQTVIAGEMATVTFAVKNTGSKTWKSSGPTQVIAIDGSAKTIKGAEVLATLKEETKPGRLAFFTVNFPAGSKQGAFIKKISLVAGGKKLSNITYNFEYIVKAPSKSAPAVVAKQETKPQEAAAKTPSAPIAQPSTGDCYKIAASGASGNCPPVTSEGPEIRIGVFSSSDPQTILGSSTIEVVDGNQNVLAQVSANTPVTVDYDESTGKYRYSYNGNSFTSATHLSVRSADQNNVMTVSTFENRPAWKPSLNDNTFLGSLEIRYNSSKNRTWIINTLALETYLKGTAEVSNDAPVEYLKAMVIAERTYATHHLRAATKHADEFFILDATYDQVYKGYGTQQRMTNLVSAVEATKGVVVTYDNEIVLTPYYSWSDGRTRSMKEVWNVDKPWLQSVQEPAGYDKTTLYGHGVGLSARGAYLLAQDHGYSAEQILKYYYRGVSISAHYHNAFNR